MSSKKEKFVIIDGNALIHRAFHAIPPLTTKKGEIVNAVYGFASILFRVYKELKPDYLAVTFDTGAPTFRHQEFKAYKATRVKADQSLYDQIPRIKELVGYFNIPIFVKEGYEADDVIGTLVTKKSVDRPDIESIIVTGDLDTLQLVDDNTKVYTLKKGVTETMIYDEESVKQRYGFPPDRMIDYKALRGDPSDNIPGVRGVGEVTAEKLIREFKTLDKLYEELAEETDRIKKLPESLRKKLIDHKKEAFLSKRLVTIVRDVPLEFSLTGAAIKNYDRAKVIEFFQEMEFKSLIDKMPGQAGDEPKGSAAGQQRLEVNFKRASEEKKFHYELIDAEEKLAGLLKKLKEVKELAVDTETTSLSIQEVELLGISLSWAEGEACYISWSLIAGLPAEALPAGGAKAGRGSREKIKRILEDEKIVKIGHNLKYDYAVLKKFGIVLKPLSFDTMVASYLMEPGRRGHDLNSVAFRELGYEMQPIEALIGPKGKKQLSMAEVPIEKVAWYSSEDADFTRRIKQKLEPALEKRAILGLFEKIEMPLVKVLAEIEENGVKVDPKLLKKMTKSVGQKLEQLKTQIYKEAGTEFNINSPLQLKEILFEKLKISARGLGRTKTGISTAADELDKLRNLHPIVDMVVSYRELAKLQSTYLEALPKLIWPDGRLHAHFNQTITATGRLSSSDPNLQNIPIRTELGNQIRKAFVAEPGFELISADYSQIELRVIASMADDEKMIKAFKRGEDIHNRTAAEMNEVEIDKVTPQMRREAKTINFGIIYGMGVHGLAEAAGISREKAQIFYDTYFALHRGIKDYVVNVVKLARTKGYAETLFGRRRYLAELLSGNQGLKAQAERMAINMPIQGTAADLMKIAMINISRKLPEASQKAKMILQVHDELVFEVPKSEVSKVAHFIRKEMESVYKLKVPIEVGLSRGENWGELEELKS